MAELNFNSTTNYQKFQPDLNGTVALSVANPNFQTVTTIAHNLGYTPNVRVWFTNAAGEICPAIHTGFSDNMYPLTSNFTLYACWYQIYDDVLRLILFRGATVAATINSTIYYRIYQDTVS